MKRCSNKLFEKLVAYKLIPADCADKAKSQYSKFLCAEVIEHKEEFHKFDIGDKLLDTLRK